MKSTVLLATALFLASAPSPDSNSISEMSGGFLSLAKSEVLLASETAPSAKITKPVVEQSGATQGREKDNAVSKPADNFVAGNQ